MMRKEGAMSDEISTITATELQSLIAADKLKRERNAAANIQKALEAEHCVLHTIIEYGSEGRIVSISYKTVAV
jgi:hypothetical protein